MTGVFRAARYLLLAGWLVAAAAPAQEARLRASLARSDTIWVGQRVELAIELLAPGYFASGVDFDLPDPDGVLVMPPESRPVVGSETIDGVQFTVQRHRLSVWPMRAGAQSVPPLTARFRYKLKPLDDDTIAASLQTDAVSFQVQVPPGAEGLGTVISARRLEVREQWDPEPGTADVPAGSAFKRTVTFTAPDVPGMVFPPFPAAAVDGLGIYPKRELLDRTNRGSLTGVRRDQITYLLERPGQFTLPAVRFTWFDLDSQRLRTEDFPARSFQVIANPDLAAAAPAAAEAPAGAGGRFPWRAAAALLTLAVAGLMAVRSRRLQVAAGRLLAPFRPVHLAPLNPGHPSQPRR